MKAGIHTRVAGRMQGGRAAESVGPRWDVPRGPHDSSGAMQEPNGLPGDGDDRGVRGLERIRGGRVDPVRPRGQLARQRRWNL